jgi:hypothetical protein
MMAVDSYLAQLSELLSAYLSRADVKALCLELDFNYDSLPPAGLDEQIGELLLALARRERLPALLEALRRKRPTVVWPDVPPGFRPPPAEAPPPPAPPAAPASKYQFGSVQANHVAIGDNARITVNRDGEPD